MNVVDLILPLTSLIAACEENTLLEQEVHSQIRNVILGIFFISLLFVGIGQTAVSTLGIPYIDDNVASKESAVYIGTRAICDLTQLIDFIFCVLWMKFILFRILFSYLLCGLNVAITIGVRILGPAAGFILGSFCTRYYVDLSNPGFGPSDPKWVGAWYLGKHPLNIHMKEKFLLLKRKKKLSKSDCTYHDSISE